MKTTQIYVEQVIIGFETVVWVALIFFCILGPDTLFFAIQKVESIPVFINANHQ